MVLSRGSGGKDRYIGVWAPGHPRANNNGYAREHILIAEKALGKPLPPGAVVHHVDMDHQNNRNDNLVICESIGYHLYLHVRMRIAARGGNPNTDKICGFCKRVFPRTNFTILRTSPDGLAAVCRKCGVVIANRTRANRMLRERAIKATQSEED